MLLTLCGRLDGSYCYAAKEIKEYNATGPAGPGRHDLGRKSEQLSGILKKMGVRHEVLNAKNHEREASIVAQAGRKGAVTVSTNMAGRGTDILLGGNPEFMTKDECLKRKIAERLPRTKRSTSPTSTSTTSRTTSSSTGCAATSGTKSTQVQGRDRRGAREVVTLGGLHIVATERHESRRIDNQLRGRAGRQGDPGSSRSSSPCRTTCCAFSAASACRI